MKNRSSIRQLTRASHPLLASLVLVFAGILSTTAAADVILVPQDFTTIQAAVDAAQPGDIVLIAPGSYGRVDVQEGISLVARRGTVTLQGPSLQVSNVPSGQTFFALGLTLGGAPPPAGGTAIAAARLTNNTGLLRFENCTFGGYPGSTGSWPSQIPSYAGGPGVIVKNCASVVLARCSAVGGNGDSLYDEDFNFPATSGGPGVLVQTSTFIAFDSSFTGGAGGDNLDTVPYDGPNGGAGVESDGTVHLAGCTLTGGHGGSADCDSFSCGSGGNGGDGVLLSAASAVAKLRANRSYPGLHGFAGGYGGYDGNDGQIVGGYGGTVVTFPAGYRPFWSDSPVTEGDTFNLYAQPATGDTEIIFASLASVHVPSDLYQGVQLISLPTIASVVLPGSGQMLTIPLVAPDLPPAVDAANFYLQAAVVDALGELLLGPLSVVTLIDDAL